MISVQSHSKYYFCGRHPDTQTTKWVDSSNKPLHSVVSLHIPITPTTRPSILFQRHSKLIVDAD